MLDSQVRCPLSDPKISINSSNVLDILLSVNEHLRPNGTLCIKGYSSFNKTVKLTVQVPIKLFTLEKH